MRFDIEIHSFLLGLGCQKALYGMKQGRLPGRLYKMFLTLPCGVDSDFLWIPFPKQEFRNRDVPKSPL